MYAFNKPGVTVKDETERVSPQVLTSPRRQPSPPLTCGACQTQLHEHEIYCTDFLHSTSRTDEGITQAPGCVKITTKITGGRNGGECQNEGSNSTWPQYNIQILASLCRCLNKILASLRYPRNEPLVLVFYDTPSPALTLMAPHNQGTNERGTILHRMGRIDLCLYCPWARHRAP